LEKLPVVREQEAMQVILTDLRVQLPLPVACVLIREAVVRRLPAAQKVEIYLAAAVAPAKACLVWAEIRLPLPLAVAVAAADGMAAVALHLQAAAVVPAIILLLAS
jgi:hypothetical protein